MIRAVQPARANELLQEDAWIIKRILLAMNVEKAWIAGGAIRDLASRYFSRFPFDGEPKDYDVFFAEPEGVETAKANLLDFEGARDASGPGDKVVDLDVPIVGAFRRIQLIRWKFYPDPVALVGDFDVVACAAAFGLEDAAEHQDFEADVARRVIHLQNLTRNVRKHVERLVSRGWYLPAGERLRLEHAPVPAESSYG